MRIRLIALSLILFVAAWLPSIAQQSSTSHPSAEPDQPAGTCYHANDGSAQSMRCCEGQDTKDVPSGKEDAQVKQATASCCDAQDGKSCCTKDAKQPAGNCCKGKDAKVCAKNGKDCCAGPDCQSCCDKNAAPTTAANSHAKTCCAAKDHSCCHPTSNA